jgi:hypothetical protein
MAVIIIWHLEKQKNSDERVETRAEPNQLWSAMVVWRRLNNRQNYRCAERFRSHTANIELPKDSSQGILSVSAIQSTLVSSNPLLSHPQHPMTHITESVESATSPRKQKCIFAPPLSRSQSTGQTSLKSVSHLCALTSRH